MSGGGSKGKSKQQSQQTSKSESGTKYNEDFMKQALQFANAPDQPTYNPEYVKGAYTPGAYTSVAPEGFAKLENSLYDTQASKLRRAYDLTRGQQREELAQSGALNSPSQYLEGSARSSLDRGYLENLQQAARDAVMGRLGAETSEAARKTDFAVNQAKGLTDWFTGESTRQTGFNEQTATQLMDSWIKKIGLAIEAGRYSKGEGQGTSYGTNNTMSGQGSIFWG